MDELRIKWAAFNERAARAVSDGYAVIAGLVMEHKDDTPHEWRVVCPVEEYGD